MKNSVRTQRKVESKVLETGNVTTEVSKVGISVVAIFGVAVGAWSLACIIGGLAASGGPLQFVGGWVKAITGM